MATIAAQGRDITSIVRFRLFALISVIIVTCSAYLSYHALRAFETTLTPELTKKAAVISHSTVADIERAVSLGIPFTDLVGVDKFLAATKVSYPEIVYLAITDPAGKLLYRSNDIGDATLAFFASEQGRSVLRTESHAGINAELASVHDHSLAIPHIGTAYGILHIGIDKGFIQSQFNDIFFDLLIILIVALLVATEITLALITFYVIGPLDRLNRVLALYTAGNFSQVLVHKGSDAIASVAAYLEESARRLNERYQSLLEAVKTLGGGQSEKLEEVGTRFGLGSLSRFFSGSIVDARIPLFIFSFAEELQKSFLPLFVKQVYQPVPYLSEEVVIGLPIAVFMGVIALATPFSGNWADRYGSRRIFMVGLVPAVAGYVGCAFATTIYELVAWRGVTALGYAMITISCQGYIAAIVTRENRAKGMAVFVGVLMSASMCGTAIGGILADRIGYRLVFALSAVFVVIAGAIAWRMLAADDDTVASKKAKEAGGTFKKLGTIFANVRFMTVVFLAAIPAKIILTGFLYYIVPLYLFTLGSSAAEIGRIMMIYPVIIIGLGPVASWTADRLGSMLWMLAVGCFVSGIGLIVFHDWKSLWGILLMVVVMGTAHAFTKAPQIAFVMEVAEKDMETVGRTTVLGLLRTMERIGSVLGPVIAASFVAIFGYEQAISMTGMLICASAVVFLLLFLVLPKPAEPEGETG